MLKDTNNIFADDARFRETFGDFQAKYDIRSTLEGAFFPFPTEGEKWSFFSRSADAYTFSQQPTQLMQDLYSLVQDKPHFVVTSNADAHFARAGFDRSNIFEVEGNNVGMQCAQPCHDTVYPMEDAVLGMRSHEQGIEIPDEYQPRCPRCGGTMQPHVPFNRAFVHDASWQAQQKALQDFAVKYDGKKLLILELGVGARNQLIKVPMMQLAASEPQAFYVSLNKSEPYVVPQLAGRSMLVDADLQELLPQVLQAK